jgi:5-methylcytosine-specific restriction endonuclease McrA
MAPGAARERVRVARRLVELPAVREGFSTGRLSYSKVRAITRVATESNEQHLVDLAGQMTASQLERTVRAYRRVSADEAVEMQRERYVSIGWDDDGCLLVKARLSPEDGAVLMAALNRAASDLIQGSREEGVPAGTPAEAGQPGDLEGHDPADAGVPAETPSETPRPWDRWGAHLADALVAMAETVVADGLRLGSGVGRHKMIVHVDAATLAAGDDGWAHLDDGTALSADAARRLGCNSSIIFVLEGPDGTVINTSPQSPTVPAALARAVRIRDGGCVFPGCTSKVWVDVHHIHFRAHGGGHSAANLATLCRAHHRLIHEGGFTVTATAPGRFVFRRPDGTEVPPLPSPPEVPPGDDTIRTANVKNGIVPGTEWMVPDWDGIAPNYPDIIDGLLHADHKPDPELDDSGP